MRNISFALTTSQFLAGTKTVTRRMGWKSLKPGTHLMAVEKGMGLRKGEKVKRLGEIEVVKVSRERLKWIGPSDVCWEGFMGSTPAQFIQFFCEANGCKPSDWVTRIEFKRIGGTG
jgi:hypothetical protein